LLKIAPFSFRKPKKFLQDLFLLSIFLIAILGSLVMFTPPPPQYPATNHTVLPFTLNFIALLYGQAKLFGSV
jgi:hypothetical protein